MMKHDKVDGGIRIEATDSEGDLLDKYQPSDGFSEPVNEFAEINEENEHIDDNLVNNIQDNL